jgi:hypothetical protein
MAGARPLTRELTVREGEKNRRERITLEMSADNEATGAVVVRPGPAPASAPTPTATYVALGAAGLGVVVGAVFTVLALDEKARCPNDAGQTHCPAPIDDHDNDVTVRRDSVIAGVGYGVAFVGGAVALLVTLTRAAPTSVSARAGVGWSGIGGSF